MIHHQICFTRLSGQGSNDGWQAVNMSPELHQEAISNFTRFQNGNITPPLFDEEDAGEQIVLELQNDGEYVFFTRIKCNAAADDRGRSIMFAHSYVFDLDEFVRNPQDVLCVEKSNFKFDIDSTKEVPSVLNRNNTKSLQECVEALGLTKQSYTTLIQCVYNILDGKTRNSMHLICDCADETIQKYMTCIYAALPFEFRKKMSFSTYEFQKVAVKTIIFDRKVKNAGNYYIIPETEENNILTETIKKRFSKYEFMRIIPYNYSSGYNLDSYYTALEEKLALFGSAQTTSLELYKIAYDLIVDEQNKSGAQTPEALCLRLNELLSAPVNHPYIDQQIQYVLGDIIEYQVELNDVLSEKLCKKLEMTQDQDLIECGYLYNSEKISRMSVEEGAKYLFNAYTNRKSESFMQIKKLLNRDAKGRAILAQLYTSLIAERLSVSKTSIQSFYDETKDLSDRSSIQSTLYKMVCAYAKAIVAKEKSPQLLQIEIDELLFSVLSDRTDAVDKAREYVKHLYWGNFDYKDLDLEEPKVYEGIALPSNRTCQHVFQLIEIFSFFKSNNVELFSQKLRSFIDNRSSTLSSSEYTTVMKKLIEACVNNKYLLSETDLDIWLYLTILLKRIIGNPIRFLIENRIKPMCRYFDDAYPKSQLLRDERIREKFVEWLTEYAQEKMDNSQ